MSDYIDRQVALDALGVTKNATKYGGDHSGYDTRMLYEIHDALTDIPAADVVPVVRCKDCKYVYCRIYHRWQESIYTCTHLRSRWNTDNDLEVNPDGFCSYGERRKQE